MILINKKVLVSGAEFFTDKDAINAQMDSSVPVNLKAAISEHSQIIESFKSAGIEVVKVDPPAGCQDGIYTANWGLANGNKVLMSRLPNKRKPEEAYSKQVLDNLGYQTLVLPDNIRAFSGQGDALPLGDTVFTQSPYRTSQDAHQYLISMLGYKEVIALQTKPVRWLGIGPARKNKLTGWPDSLTYDIDLAIAIIRPETSGSKALIAYCPSVFKSSSVRKLRRLANIDKIEVSKSEAMKAFALNLVSTGETVIMNAGAPNFVAELQRYGFKTIELELPELMKGGGSIRCSSLTLSNT